MNQDPIIIPPVPENPDQKEVFAFFGLCSFYAQVFEQGVINLTVGLSVRGVSPLKTNDILDYFATADQKTLGQLLNAVRNQKINIPAEIDTAVTKALRNRNYLAHKFYVNHDVAFGSTSGRRNMIAELRSMIEAFKVADRLVEDISIPLWAKLGLTTRIIQDELLRMKAEAMSMESS